MRHSPRRINIIRRYKALKGNSNWWEEGDFSNHCSQTYTQQQERRNTDKIINRQNERKT